MAEAAILADPPAAPAAVIGPNAVLQTEAALREAGGAALAERVFARAGLIRLLREPPGAMIDEAVPQALFRALFEALPRGEALEIARHAGELTGEYILENRIPRLARALLKRLPPRLAAPLLLSAVERHAWTFAGSGVCTTQPGKPARLSIAANPLAMPECAWHAGVIETLFRALVSARARIDHEACCHDGAPACRFAISITPRDAPSA